MMSYFSALTKYGCFFLILIAMVGCGNKNTAVTGTVTLDGVPVEKASLFFTPISTTGESATGETDASGKYLLRVLRGGETGAVPGEYSVTIYKREEVNSGKTEPDLYDPNKRIPVMTSKDVLPAIYGDATKSPLKATITKGNKTPIDFKLESK